jgi:hypothetical protein
MFMCPIPNGFWDTPISLYSTLCTVHTSNTPCYHTSCKVHSLMLTVDFSQMYYTR